MKKTLFLLFTGMYSITSAQISETQPINISIKDTHLSELQPAPPVSIPVSTNQATNSFATHEMVFINQTSQHQYTICWLSDIDGDRTFDKISSDSLWTSALNTPLELSTSGERSNNLVRVTGSSGFYGMQTNVLISYAINNTSYWGTVSSPLSKEEVLALKEAVLPRISPDDEKNLVLLIPSSADNLEKVLAESISEFSFVQGQDGWLYGYLSSEQFVLFPAHGTYDWWVLPNTHPKIWSWGCIASASHPVVRRWLSEIDGTVRITGYFADSNLNYPDQWDGINVAINIGETPVFSRYVANTGSISFDITATVLLGQAVDFVVSSPGDNNFGDNTKFECTITSREKTSTLSEGRPDDM